MTITSLPDTASMTIEDVQGRADTRRIPINRVGIKDIRHPVRVSERSGGQAHDRHGEHVCEPPEGRERARTCPASCSC